MKKSEIPEELYSDAHTNFINSVLLMHEINKILWWEEMKILMPLVAKELVKKGVKFPNEKIR